MTTVKPKILFVGDAKHDGEPAVLDHLRETCEVVEVSSASRALGQLQGGQFAGVYLASDVDNAPRQISQILQNERVLQEMPDGLVVVDLDSRVVWANARFKQWAGRDDLAGVGFFEALGSPAILGPDYCPFHTAVTTGQSAFSTLRSADNRHFQIHACGLAEANQTARHLIVTVRDVSNEVFQQQKLAAIHQAGVELADLTPEELQKMTVDERKELLKSNILHFSKDLLKFDVVEIRLLDSQTGQLKSVLAEGLTPEATNRVLYALPDGNGVTGYVASTGKSYLCEDTCADSLFLEGCRDARSSLTVPLVLHDEVIGTFNVESPKPGAFDENDLHFLEVFGRDVAVALNTLELLVVENATAASKSVEAIHSAVALPVDAILNDAVNVMERYIGHEPEVVERLQRILQNAREIRQLIQKVGQSLAPADAQLAFHQCDEMSVLRGKRILVADADENVRSAAHKLLERYGCVVETAHDGAEAIFMTRNMLLGGGYDVIIADIRLPDMNGYELMLKLQEVIDPVPLVLMTGFGWDPGHSIANARRAGLPAYALLYKPFRLDQLLETVEKIINSPGPVSQA